MGNIGASQRRNAPEIGSRLRVLRETNGKSQQVVADFCCIHQTTLGGYERGLYLPGLDVLSRLADYYSVSLDYLLGRTDERKNLNV
ncbi:helix-turn-helix domain-containing protein [Ruminococcaceae bacterium OttesenSCG-928-I18]|nr:helix-turn-helix domain-containing protein [Ruminococcaceae bacterium OttesenSCG-928-I18]